MSRVPAVLILTLTAALGTPMARTSAEQRHPPAKKPAQRAKPAPPPALACGDPLAFEVLLDRQNFSPGEIGAKLGANAAHAIAALQTARGLEPTGDADCDTWHALGGDTSGSMIATYTIEEADVKGPFVRNIPKDLERQASLPALSYRSSLERLGERFQIGRASCRERV